MSQKPDFFLGKLHQSALKKLVLPYRGRGSRAVVVGPSYGVDVGICRSNGKYLVTSSDPVTGAESDLGTYAVNVSSNDVATSGARPAFMTNVILLSPNSSSKTLTNILEQINSACVDLGISILGGHTEVTPSLTRPIVITSCFGFAEKFYTANAVRAGDCLAMTKTAGIEGTAILAGSRRAGLDPSASEKIRRDYLRKMSVVREAAIAAGSGCVHAMHDATEGGVLGGSIEMADSSKVGLVIDEWRIPISNETRIICKNLGIDPLRLISSGVLLMALDQAKAGILEKLLKRSRIQFSVIGQFTRKRKIMTRDGKGKVRHPSEIMDEIWRFQNLLPVNKVRRRILVNV